MEQAQGVARGGDAPIGHDRAQFVWTRLAQHAATRENRNMAALDADRNVTADGPMIRVARNLGRGIEQFVAMQTTDFSHPMGHPSPPILQTAIMVAPKHPPTTNPMKMPAAKVIGIGSLFSCSRVDASRGSSAHSA
jgi:hypothetical protein